MKTLLKFMCTVALAIAVSACATGQTSNAPTPNAVLQSATETVNSYVSATRAALSRGRISADQADQAHANAGEARKKIAAARAAFALCKPQVPCTDYLVLLEGLSPDLIQLEAELRKREGAAK